MEKKSLLDALKELHNELRSNGNFIEDTNQSTDDIGAEIGRAQARTVKRICDRLYYLIQEYNTDV